MKILYFIHSLQETTLSNVFYVSSEFSPELVHALLEMLDKYGKAELKGQRVTKKVLKEKHSAIARKIDFPPSKLKMLRGDVTGAELLQLVEEVNLKRTSLVDLESELLRIKEMRAVQNAFVKHSNSVSWEDAKQRLDII